MFEFILLSATIIFQIEHFTTIFDIKLCYILNEPIEQNALNLYEHCFNEVNSSIQWKRFIFFSETLLDIINK